MSDSRPPDIRIARVRVARSRRPARGCWWIAYGRAVSPRRTCGTVHGIAGPRQAQNFGKWFGHNPGKWAFRRRTRQNPDAVECCLAWCCKGAVTLFYAARDSETNQAVVLRDYLMARSTTEDESYGPFER